MIPRWLLVTVFVLASLPAAAQSSDDYQRSVYELQRSTDALVRQNQIDTLRQQQTGRDLDRLLESRRLETERAAENQRLEDERVAHRQEIDRLQYEVEYERSRRLHDFGRR